MSDLAQFAHYTGAPPPPRAAKADPKAAAGKRALGPRPANGGATGPLNRARIGALRIAPLAARKRAS
jgi:hypothetical protein